MNILKKTYGYCIFKGSNQDAAKAVCSEMYHLGSDGTHTMISYKQAWLLLLVPIPLRLGTAFGSTKII